MEKVSKVGDKSQRNEAVTQKGMHNQQSKRATIPTIWSRTHTERGENGREEERGRCLGNVTEKAKAEKIRTGEGECKNGAGNKVAHVIAVVVVVVNETSKCTQKYAQV